MLAKQLDPRQDYKVFSFEPKSQGRFSRVFESAGRIVLYSLTYIKPTLRGAVVGGTLGAVEGAVTGGFDGAAVGAGLGLSLGMSIDLTQYILRGLYHMSRVGITQINQSSKYPLERNL